MTRQTAIFWLMVTAEKAAAVFSSNLSDIDELEEKIRAQQEKSCAEARREEEQSRKLRERTGKLAGPSIADHSPEKAEEKVRELQEN